MKHLQKGKQQQMNIIIISTSLTFVCIKVNDTISIAMTLNNIVSIMSILAQFLRFEKRKIPENSAQSLQI